MGSSYCNEKEMNGPLLKRRMWELYFVERTASLLRLQLANIVYLCLGLGVSAYSGGVWIHSRNVAVWLTPAVVSLFAIIIGRCYESTAAHNGFNLNYYWPRVGLFVLSLRCYHLVILSLSRLLHDHTVQEFCNIHSDSESNIQFIIYFITDLMEAYVWSTFLFPYPWGFTLCAAELTTSLLHIEACWDHLTMYLSHPLYALVVIISYYFILSAYNYLMLLQFETLAHDLFILETEKSFGLSGNAEASRTFKIAAQSLSDSIAQLSASGINLTNRPSSVTDMQTFVRNINSIKLLAENISLSASLESEGSSSQSESFTTFCTQSEMEELIQRFKDSSTQAISVNIYLGDKNETPPIIQCSSSSMYCILNSLILHSMSSVRRRSLRQKAGYRPYINVVGYVYENEKKNDVIFRLILDHNGDIPNFGESVSSSTLLSGTEVFSVPGSAGRKVEHYSANRGTIFSVRSLRVLSIWETFMQTEVEYDQEKLPPLSVSTAKLLLQECGGSLTVEEYYVDDDKIMSRSLRFCRLITEFSSKKLEEARVDRDVDRQPRQHRRGSKKMDSVPKDMKYRANRLNCALIISDRALLPPLCNNLFKINVDGDMFACDMWTLSNEQLSQILSNRYKFALFDAVWIGKLLFSKKFKGKLVLLQEDNMDAYYGVTDVNKPYVDVTIPWSCSQQDLRKLFLEDSGAKELLDSDGPQNANSVKKIRNSVFCVNQLLEKFDKFRILCFMYLQSTVLYIVIANFVRKVYKYLQFALYWVFLGRADSYLPDLEARRGKLSIKAAKHLSQQSIDNFQGACLAMPCFRPDVEARYAVWKIFDKTDEYYSNSFVILFSLILESYISILIVFLILAVVGCLLYSDHYVFRGNLRKLNLFTNFVSGLVFLDSFVAFVLFLNWYYIKGSHLQLESDNKLWYFLLSSVISVPFLVLLLSYASCHFSMSMISILTWVFHSAAALYFLYVHRHLHDSVSYCILVSFWIILLTSFFRLYEYEFFKRLKYQVVMRRHSQKFFSALPHVLFWNEARYPMISLLKQRNGVFSDLAHIFINQPRSTLSHAMLELIARINMNYLKLETENSIKLFMGYIDDLEVEIRDSDIISIREELSFIAFSFEHGSHSQKVEISIMIDPNLIHIKFDVSIFRMILINALCRAIQRCNVPRIAKSDTDTPSFTEEKNSNLLHQSNEGIGIREILIQIGCMSQSEKKTDIETAVRNNFMFDFLVCDPDGNVTDTPYLGSLHGENMRWVSIAVVDNGDTTEGTDPGSVVCKKIVTEYLNGLYSDFEFEKGFRYSHITRFSFPAELYDIPFVPSRSLRGRVWHPPSVFSRSNIFERPSVRFDFLRNLYSKRKLEGNVSSDDNNNIDTRQLLMVCPDELAGHSHCSPFLMQGWKCSVVSFLSDVISYPELCNVDAVIVCTSVLQGTDSTLLSLEELKYCGYYGGLVCLVDAFSLPKNTINDSYFPIHLPILNNTVRLVNEVADKALFLYLCGCDTSTSM